MAEEAKVRSVESLEYFRSALINYLTKARQALRSRSVLPMAGT